MKNGNFACFLIYALFVLYPIHSRRSTQNMSKETEIWRNKQNEINLAPKIHKYIKS